MGDLADGEMLEVRGSAAKPYELRNVGGVYSCTCPAWRNQNRPPESRTCKHLKALRGVAAEEERLGAPVTPLPSRTGEEKAPPLLLAHSWDNEADLTGWWMSEKLDGVRAFWDGERMVSRLGNPFHVPDWFLENLPRTPLDGELWGGRGKFQSTVSIVRRQDKGPQWRAIQYLVFDAPGLNEPFEARQEALTRLGVQVLEQSRCEGLDHLREELKRVEALGGEGLMLRQPGSRYEAGRSSTLLKVKSFRDDEARVLGHQPGAGRHAGRLGALLVELANGKQFSVGTGFSDAERSNPPPIGSLITFRYQELSDAGIPRFPSYVGVRLDRLELSSPCRASCCFCGEAVPADPSGRRVRVSLERPGGPAQDWWAHEKCLASRLHPAHAIGRTDDGA